MIASKSRLAITGMAICNALGNNIDEVWANTLDMKSGVVTLETKHDDPPDFFDAVSYRPGLKSYCDVLAHTKIDITRENLGMPPQDFRVMSMSTKLTMLLAGQAMAGAGLATANYDPRRVAVIISQNAGEAANTLWDLNLSMHSPWIVNLAGLTLNLDENQKEIFRKALTANRLTPDESTMLCRLNSTTAGLISNKYNFAGPSYAVSSACSSSLMALYTAMNLMRTGAIDAAVIGGAEEVYSSLWLAEFSAIGALGKRVAPYTEPAQISRPFDLNRTGFVFGEGGAMLVVERESSARKRGANIHGIIGGAGCVTNTRGIIEPSAAAQIEATKQAFAEVDYGPEAVDLIECHATATQQGDREEGLAVAEAYARHGGAYLAAYKSQIGHTVGSSGLMAMIRGLLAMRDKVIPGSLNYDQPDPSINLQASGLKIISSPQQWPAPPSGIRRLQVNSFGFGGSNLIFQIEENNERIPGKISVNMPESLEAADGFEGKEETIHGVNMVLTPHMGEIWRLGSVNPSWRMELAGLPAAPSKEEFEALARKGLWLRKEQTAPPLAVMCCGQGAVWPGMGRALYDSLPAAREAMDSIARIADWDVLGLMDETEPEKITLTRWQQPYLFLVEYAQFAYLQSLGLSPTAMLGHSLGELIALCLSGVYTPKEAWYIIDTRACLMGRMEAESDRGTGMMALHAPADAVSKVLEEYPGLAVSNYNSPNQVILGGPRDLLLEARKDLRKRKMPAVMLPMSLAFHYPGMRVLREESMDSMECVDMRPARLPMLSNVTAGLYPNEHGQIISYIADLDENPVRWPDCVQTMWNSYGVRHFLELGPADVLCGLVSDIVPESECVSANRKNKEIEGMRIAVARLFAMGHLPQQSGAKSVAKHVDTAPAKVVTKAAESAQTQAAQNTDPMVEAVMPVIIEATGYERHELEADMDLRHDLAIRSSRFPLIMHEAEKRFNISMGFEDLLGVATIRDLAYKIAELQNNDPNAKQHPKGAASSGTTEAKAPNEAPKPVLRYTTELFSLETGDYASQQARIMPLEHIFYCGQSTHASTVLDKLGAWYGRDKIVALKDDDGPQAFAGKANRGLFIFMDAEEGPADPTQVVSRHFSVIKNFLTGKGAQICCLIGKGHDAAQAGVAGLILSGALENSGTAFHCARIEDTAPANWLEVLLDKERTPRLPIMIAGENGKIFTKRLAPAALDPAAKGLGLKANDVVLVSGGAGGIAAAALAGLAEAGCKLVILGRSARPAKDAPIWHLAALGAEVDYISCDIVDLASVSAAVDQVKAKYGRIDGIFHAAGLLMDSSLADMENAQFEAVMAVKCRGLHNLTLLAKPLGLHYALGFSSLAAWLGNYGQANYSAANAAMAAMLEQMASADMTTCCIMLPPVAGSGMAGNLSDEMKRRGLAESFIEEAELGDLFRREICCTPGGNILWARNIPVVPGVPVPAAPHKKALAGVVERPEMFPLVFPLKSEGMIQFTGGVHFSHFKHDWLAASKNAEGISFVPSGMALECLFEAAGQFMPWLRPAGARGLRWPSTLPCPAGLTREGEIACRPLNTGDAGRSCSAELKVADVSANGRRAKTQTMICEGEIIMATPYSRRSLKLPHTNADFTSNLSPREIAIPGNAGYMYPLALFETICSAASKFANTGKVRQIQSVTKLDFILLCDPDAIVCIHLRHVYGQGVANEKSPSFDVWATQGNTILMTASGLELKKGE